MSIPSRRGPKALSEILGELFTARGYGQFRARAELEAAWAGAVGDAACRQTELGEVRRGVLNVTVAHSALLEELSAFGKPGILAALRTGAPGTTIHDIRFRVGTVGTGKSAVGVGGQAPAGPAVGPTEAVGKERGRRPGRPTGREEIRKDDDENHTGSSRL